MTATEDHATAHVVEIDENGLPFAYQRSVLRTDPDRLSDTLKEIERIQEGPAPKLKGVQIRRHQRRGSGFLELDVPKDVDARDVRNALRDLGLKTADLGLVPGYLADDPERFKGLPMRHGHGGGTTREGIYLVGLAPPPESPALEAGRRPVVAVLDTPVRQHAWLGDGNPDDSFWFDARRVADAWAPDFDVPEEGVNGRARAAGHGTFIAGMVRQLAPDARVLSVPVMDRDGIVDEEHVLDALRWLLERVKGAVDGRHERFVDVVNLSFGRYVGPDEHEPDTAKIGTVLGELAQLGVLVVASAGNRPVKDDMFPAILSKKGVQGPAALVSVGARDPDGTLADYTSTGKWVTVKAPGTSVVSTLPKFGHTKYPLDEDFDDDRDLTNPDPNFQASGIGKWSGTSFAAGWVSGSIAAKLLQQAKPDSLVDVKPAAAKDRAKSARDAVVADLEALDREP